MTNSAAPRSIDPPSWPYQSLRPCNSVGLSEARVCARCRL